MSRHLNRNSVIKPLAVTTNSEEVYKLSHAPKFKHVKQYLQEKLTMLMDPHGFCIYPTKTEIQHLYDIATESKIKNWSDRKTEETINRAVRQIIDDHWG